MPSRTSLLLTLATPATGILVATYFYNRPLLLPKSRKISSTEELSHSFKNVSGRSLEIINPRNHAWTSDSRSITLRRSEIAKSRKDDGNEEGTEVGDEEILARFVKGFFRGWSFTPERGLLALLARFGRKFIPVGYSVMEAIGEPLSLDGLSKTHLPEKGTVLFGGNFMILDTHIAHPSSSTTTHSPPLGEKQSLGASCADTGYQDPVISFVDIAFGDDRRNFAGLHRFEIRGEKEGEIIIWYSSMSCNPSIDKAPFPKWVFGFHVWYAMCLFKDGVEEVIRG
ncbi:uncharacterized protein PAC_05736 [Phialocephala subalpina]|uniref:Uncharacterized protein n=1 Tax=Phialocephala subalpina TaxID=576137 RepID=A0A1L7WSU2_9HELO|nr:uncharacterized protein PAC_05736 [Phialocephala subalpina]